VEHWRVIWAEFFFQLKNGFKENLPRKIYMARSSLVNCHKKADVFTFLFLLLATHSVLKSISDSIIALVEPKGQ